LREIPPTQLAVVLYARGVRRRCKACTIQIASVIRKFAVSKARFEPSHGMKPRKLLNQRLATASKAGKDRVAFLGSPGGPTFGKIVQTFLGAYGSSHANILRAHKSKPARNAAKTLFGRRDLPAYRIDQAEVLISFGADFLETWQSPVELARQYALFRAPQKRRGSLTIGRATTWPAAQHDRVEVR